MKNLSNYPLSLQLLMHTDGTVTELIKLLAQEDIRVVKLIEKINSDNDSNILDRHIYLQGIKTDKIWLYAHSKIFLSNLPKKFVTDLLENAIPIGTLWNNYRMETYKKMLTQHVEKSDGCDDSGFEVNTILLTRTYQVFNQKKTIMEITEKFPLNAYQNL